jgi:hypothetical protein
MTSNTRLKTNPLVLITDKVRLTIVPAISFAFGRLKDLRTTKRFGATITLKEIAAPSHAASSNILRLLRMTNGS